MDIPNVLCLNEEVWEEVQKIFRVEECLMASEKRRMGMETSSKGDTTGLMVGPKRILIMAMIIMVLVTRMHMTGIGKSLLLASPREL